jgi:hypothetical protein
LALRKIAPLSAWVWFSSLLPRGAAANCLSRVDISSVTSVMPFFWAMPTSLSGAPRAARDASRMSA